MSTLYRFLARSDHWLARGARRAYRAGFAFHLPAPRVVAFPLLGGFLLARGLYHFVLRVCLCEPVFKAYCKRYGRGLRTGVYVPWVQGRGDIIVGDRVVIDGRFGIVFASRFSAHPTLRIGDDTGIGHNGAFVIGKAITIGRRCRIAPNVRMFDSSGHPSDPAAREAGLPPQAEDVRPITVEDNVWIGSNSIIFPGVTLGEGCVVSAGSVVLADVPAYTVVAGNPARKVMAQKAEVKRLVQPGEPKDSDRLEPVTEIGRGRP